MILWKEYPYRFQKKLKIPFLFKHLFQNRKIKIKLAMQYSNWYPYGIHHLFQFQRGFDAGQLKLNIPNDDSIMDKNVRVRALSFQLFVQLKSSSIERLLIIKIETEILHFKSHNMKCIQKISQTWSISNLKY